MSHGSEPLLRQRDRVGEGSSDKALKISQIIKENVFPLQFNSENLLDFGVSQLLYILLEPQPILDWEPGCQLSDCTWDEHPPWTGSTGVGCRASPRAIHDSRGPFPAQEHGVQLLSSAAHLL